MQAKGKFQVQLDLDGCGFMPLFSDEFYPDFPHDGLFLSEQAAIRYVDDFRCKSARRRAMPIRILEVKCEFAASKDH